MAQRFAGAEYGVQGERAEIGRGKGQGSGGVEEGQFDPFFCAKNPFCAWTLLWATIKPETSIDGPMGPPRPSAISAPDATSFQAASKPYVVPGGSRGRASFSRPFPGPDRRTSPAPFARRALPWRPDGQPSAQQYDIAYHQASNLPMQGLTCNFFPTFVL